jgi:hypothetical protein
MDEQIKKLSSIILEYQDSGRTSSDGLARIIVEQLNPKFLPLDFVTWYSGMEEEKILRAYARYKREEV